jgi:hypothetical protein
MSARVQAAVWEHSRATGSAFVVMLRLAERADRQGCAWPGVESLARDCRCSRSTVKRSLKELQALGELEVVVKGGGRRADRRYATNLYKVLVHTAQDEPPGLPDGPQSACSRSTNPDPVGPAVDHKPITEPSRTAAGPVENFVDHAAYAKLCRDLLKNPTPSRPRVGPLLEDCGEDR